MGKTIGTLARGVALCSLMTTSAIAKANDAAALFGARENVLQASLSPDGNTLALVQPVGTRGSGLFVADVTGDTPVDLHRILMAKGDPERISSCHWASNTRLLCNIFGIMPVAEVNIAYMTRMVAIDRDGANMALIEVPHGTGEALDYTLDGGSVIDWTAGAEGHVLMARNYVPETQLGHRLVQSREGLGVDDIDTVTLKALSNVRPRPDASEYLSDGRGAVRVTGRRRQASGGYDRGGVDYFYRARTSDDWLPLSQVDENGDGFDPYAIDPVLDAVYGLKRVDGRLAAFRKALDVSNTEQMVFAHPQVDVDGFLRIGRSRRTVGVTYATDRREATYFDPALAKLAKSLAAALPALPLIRFVDASQDENRLLIWAGSDVNPGSYYLFDKTTRRLDEMTRSRPDLSGVTLATVKAVRYRAADGTMVPAYLTLPPDGAGKGLPAIVMPHGGPGSRDEWGFDWLAQYYAMRGYAVLQPNFRGSTGYGDKWFQNNGFRSWPIAIGDVLDGGRWLVSEGIADPARLAIVGWSYGGYAALQSAVVDPTLFKAVIAIAPVTELARLKEERRNWSDFLITSRFVGDGAHIDEGSPARHADRIAVPVLMFHGRLDRNVSVAQSRLMDARLRDAGKQSELVIYDGLDHYLEDSAARAAMLEKSAAFLSTAFAR